MFRASRPGSGLPKAQLPRDPHFYRYKSTKLGKAGRSIAGEFYLPCNVLQY